MKAVEFYNLEKKYREDNRIMKRKKSSGGNLNIFWEE